MAKKAIKKKNRDDFSPAIIRKLKEMAGDICSMPDCRVITGGAKLLRDNTFSIGVAAHICAAAPGGPRFDPKMTSEQRKSYENGVWLCHTHARMIDANPDKFSTALLQSWRECAEVFSMSSVGQKLITELEHGNAIRRAVGRSIIDYLGSDNPLSIPVGDLISGYEESLSDIDPRFMVKVVRNYAGTLEHQIFARPGEVGAFKINFKNVLPGSEVEKSIRNFFDHGGEAKFEAGNYEFLGSKLLEKISEGKSGSLHIQSNKRPIEVIVYTRMDDGSEDELATFACHAVAGAKYGKIEGKAFAGLLGLKIDFSIAASSSPNITLTFNSTPWLGQPVNRLSYFSRFQRISRAFEGLKKLSIAVEFIQNHQPHRLGSAEIGDMGNFFKILCWHVAILSAARLVSDKLLEPLIVKNFSMSRSDEDELLKYSSLLEGDIVQMATEGHEFCRGHFTSEGRENFGELFEPKDGSRVRFIEDGGAFFNVLGNYVKAPPVNIAIEDCIVDRFDCPNDENEQKDGFIVRAGCNTKYIMSLDMDQQWVLDER